MIELFANPSEHSLFSFFMYISYSSLRDGPVPPRLSDWNASLCAGNTTPHVYLGSPVASSAGAARILVSAPSSTHLERCLMQGSVDADMRACGHLIGCGDARAL